MAQHPRVHIYHSFQECVRALLCTDRDCGSRDHSLFVECNAWFIGKFPKGVRARGVGEIRLRFSRWG